MADQFDRIMEKFLTPISRLGPRIKDSVYFLRKDGCFVFSHGYYHPTPGYFLAKIIYYPQDSGSATIWGRRYEAMHKAWINGVHVAILNDAQIKKHFEIDSSLDPRAPRPLVGNYVLQFPLSDFIGFFEPLDCLRKCEEMYPLIKNWAEETCTLMDFPAARLGVSGSLSYGRVEEQDMDFDVLFMGDLHENDRVLKKIYEVAEDPRRRVFEFGRYWPIRIYHKGILICPFFVYRNWDDAPLSEGEMTLIRERVEGTALITDDLHNSYLPIVLELAEVKIGGRTYKDIRFISYDGSIRGEYRKGDRIRFQGRIIGIKDRRKEYEALVVDIGYNIARI